MSCLSTNTTTTTTAPSSSPPPPPPPPNTSTTATATADQLHERYYSPKTYSSFDTDINTHTRLNINLDPTGHAYLPFHPTSFGFEFPPNSSFPFSLGSSTGRLVMGMMQNPIDIDVNNTTIDNNSVGEASTTLPTSKQDWGYAHTRTHITVNPSDLSSFSEIDQNRRRESGESGTSTVVSRVLDVGDDDEEDEEDELRSPSSSRSGSPEVVIQTKVEVVPKTERTLGSRSRSISASASALASGFRTRSPEGEREGEREYSPVPPRRATRRRSSVKSSVGSDDDDDADSKGDASGKKGKNGNRNKKIKLAPKRTTSNTSSGSTSNSNSNSASSNSTSTSTTTSTSSDAVVHHPDSAFHIPDPPHPFSFKDLGLQPPPPFCSSEAEAGCTGTGSGEEDDDVGNDGRVVVKGKRREMNRVAAKRHREKNKDRLKSLEKRKVWLDHAVAEYEKSNKRLSETLDRLKRENMMLKGIDVGA